MKTVKPIVLAMLLLPLQSWALDSDRDAPIEVEADRLEMREQDNISIYEGNVRLVQGSLKINSDRLVIHFNDANELTLMEMTGKPARLRQLDNEQQQILGEAEQMDYSNSQSLLIMRQSAYLDHGGDIIRSDLIRFDTETNNIEAGSTQSDDRVKMVIKPRQNSAPAPPGASD
jgi:lipopolysaccharide export system protein LptA